MFRCICIFLLNACCIRIVFVFYVLFCGLYYFDRRRTCTIFFWRCAFYLFNSIFSFLFTIVSFAVVFFYFYFLLFVFFFSFDLFLHVTWHFSLSMPRVFFDQCRFFGKCYFFFKWACFPAAVFLFFFFLSQTPHLYRIFLSFLFTILVTFFFIFCTIFCLNISLYVCLFWLW